MRDYLSNKLPLGFVMANDAHFDVKVCAPLIDTTRKTNAVYMSCGINGEISVDGVSIGISFEFNAKDLFAIAKCRSLKDCINVWNNVNAFGLTPWCKIADFNYYKLFSIKITSGDFEQFKKATSSDLFGSDPVHLIYRAAIAMWDWCAAKTYTPSDYVVIEGRKVFGLRHGQCNISVTPTRDISKFSIKSDTTALVNKYIGMIDENFLKHYRFVGDCGRSDMLLLNRVFNSVNRVIRVKFYH